MVFGIARPQADEAQDVMHFNYTAWPDHGVPPANAAESILQFVFTVRQQAAKSKGPMVIHCRYSQPPLSAHYLSYRCGKKYPRTATLGKLAEFKGLVCLGRTSG